MKIGTKTQQAVAGCGAYLALAIVVALTFGPTPSSWAQTQQQAPAATKEGAAGNDITGDRRTPLLSIQREREAVVVPVACAQGIRKDVELQPADASVTFTFDCLCGDDSNALKRAMMSYRDDYMRVYRGEIKLEDMGTASDYFADVALPFMSDGKGGTQLTLRLEPGEKQERTIYCYTADDFKIIDDWAKYIIFGN
jgi:hypothetical protein